MSGAEQIRREHREELREALAVAKTRLEEAHRPVDRYVRSRDSHLSDAHDVLQAIHLARALADALDFRLGQESK